MLSDCTLTQVRPSLVLSTIAIYVLNSLGAVLTRSIRDFETPIDFVQGLPGSRRERVN